MKPSKRTTVAASLLLIACVMGSVAVLRQLDQLRSQATLEEVLYLPSPKLLRRLSLGYNGLLADIYWTRAVQYFGSKHHVGATEYKLLAPLLEITTHLDPQLVIAYQFGANFLAPAPPDGAGMPERAIELTNFGIRNNPNEWKLYYELGFIYYTELKDYAGAADAFRRGSEVPGAHPFLKVLAGKMAEHAGELDTARLMWVAAYKTTEDRDIRANAAAHLNAIQVDEDVTNLEKLVEEFRKNTGRLAGSLADLIAARMLTELPRDPLGHPYRLTADGRVEVRDPDDLPFLQKGLPPGYVPPLVPKFPKVE
jgi:tetratricopeptide (TPR) repeat protein